MGRIVPDLYHQTAAFIQANDLIPRAARVLVAVSGGLDSVCLLHLLRRLSSCADFTLGVAHLDHQLRSASAADARFVADLCRCYALPCWCEKVDVRRIAQQRGQGVEEAARHARYSFLARVASEHDFTCIALAHHRDDQAETVLLRLTRGSSVAGLAAMRPRRGRFIRPLLQCSRSGLAAYAAEHHLDWVEDGSNASLDYQRNRIRHQVMPQLCQINSAAAANIARLAQLCAVDDDYWRRQIRRWLDEHAFCSAAEIRLSRQVLAEEHPALAVRVVRSALAAVRGGLHGIAARHLELVLALLRHDGDHASIDLPGAWCGCEYAQLVVRRCSLAPLEPFRLAVAAPCRVLLPDGRVLEFSRAVATGADGVDQVEFCAAEIDFPLEVRPVAAGDRISCVGMTGHKLVKKIFTDRKVPRAQRRRAVVVGSGGRLLWVVALARCAQHRAQQRGEEVLRVRLLNSKCN